MNASAHRADEKTVARAPDRGVARRQAFLHAARTVFLEQGYEAASVNDVVRLAGGSLATLYAQFGNKEGLFLAIIQDEHERLTEAMTPKCVDHLPLEQGLQQIGEQFLRTILTRESLAFFRIVVGEGRKFPQSVQRYVFTGADKVREVVVKYLRHAAPEFKGDYDSVASYFLEVLRSRHQYRALADDAYALSDAEFAAHVGHAVRFIVNGLRLY
ncbi:MAG TPA: TetR/AcrR family transcriptional regulator [Vitreimonas sp.]|uniref:TetR/AcrR family transcriptional regulator n=1 Tax=Vitreimonas sp. TaxID=3069702 RepID=UPI002D558573|nr:TetR/AcrR family transcriptional regulator [Vitreimonas sp.]HYD86490.1 TetR/AcrR family transcriptional regulator [Vitreimonas sp.]